MPVSPPTWTLAQSDPPPEGFLAQVHSIAPRAGKYTAQLLWQRGIQTPEQLAGFLDPDRYSPTSPFELPEMQSAVARLLQARNSQEKVAIWGDFDADGITATAVLWEGLSQFLSAPNLSYTIPNRLQESHGLSRKGLERLQAEGVGLIVTCDNGSTNEAEITYANHLGIEVIVTDHHTLPPDRPAVVALVNPRALPSCHPLAHLSGVAVAYKLIEALYLTLPQLPEQSLEQLLDLVAIGLIADLVELRGDGRYLAQQGIARLQTQLTTRSRPGVARLLELCKRTGDRPTDISFGIGPRINAVSRIHGDARFCVELLTSREPDRCEVLAQKTELANARRQVLQKELVKQVKERLSQVDLSTTQAIVLLDNQWDVGILGLVSGQIAQEYGRPTILLTTDAVSDSPAPETIARGSARSVQGIDLYQLFAHQSHLLLGYGGHPLAAGLSLCVGNLPLFTEAISQELRQRLGDQPLGRTVAVDLGVTVAELGQDLFQQLKLLEPCGMGNPPPKLMLHNCWFRKIWHQNIKEPGGQKIRFIKTEFELWDASVTQGFPGIWWGHYAEELPQEPCDLVVELDFNTHAKRYEVRLLDLRPRQAESWHPTGPAIAPILDWRSRPDGSQAGGISDSEAVSVLQIKDCPERWEQLRPWFRRAQAEQKSLAIAYRAAEPCPPLQIWQSLVGLAKYLSRTGQGVTSQQLQTKLGIGPLALELGLQALDSLGFSVQPLATGWQFSYRPAPGPASPPALQTFLRAIQEQQFRQRYFQQVSLSTLQAEAEQTLSPPPALPR
jgi:single-stranded-DNA-specific exonuclease